MRLKTYGILQQCVICEAVLFRAGIVFSGHMRGRAKSEIQEHIVNEKLAIDLTFCYKNYKFTCFLFGTFLTGNNALITALIVHHANQLPPLTSL